MLNKKSFDKRWFDPMNILLRHTLIYKLCIIAAVLYYFSTIIHYITFQSSETSQFSTNEALELISKDVRYADFIRKPGRFFKTLKYILLWTPSDYAPFMSPEGQTSFITHNCSYVNCYITSDRKLLADITMYDAIAFNGRKIEHGMEFPTSRSPRQKYIYFNMESADNYPVCSRKFDGFFDWTATYRMDSDIPWTYIIILDKEGKQIGPKKNMDWITNIPETDNVYTNMTKNKAAAWFVSNCHSKNKREEFVENLQKALKHYDLQVDVYGGCGKFSCPRDKYQICNSKLKESYFFYLSLENSFSDDYVTEKLLTALNNFAVPIVFGGADYTRFLPPGSYINSRDYNSSELAELMNQLIQSSKQYVNYFKWRDHYKYIDGPDMCSLCAALNNRTMLETRRRIDKFRSWWHPNYRDIC